MALLCVGIHFQAHTSCYFSRIENNADCDCFILGERLASIDLFLVHQSNANRLCALIFHKMIRVDYETR